MTPSSHSFLYYLNTNYSASDSQKFVHLTVDFIKQTYPDLEFCIIQHIPAPDCYKIQFAKDGDEKYVELLKNENIGQISEHGEFYKSGDILIFPLTDYNNQVKYVTLFNSCSGDMVDELSVVFRDIREVFRFVTSQKEKNSRSANLNTANLISQMSHDLNSLIALLPQEFAKDDILNARINFSEMLSRELIFYLRELFINKSKVSLKNLFLGITSGILIPENIKFNLEFIDNLDSLTVDVELIDRAVESILMNAVMATSFDGGEIKMTVGKRKNVSMFIKYDWLEISITDTGPGIAKEFLDEVKNPLFTTWKNQGHVGLGLAIADKIIQAHNGHLDIKSDGEKGTTVSIYIPLS